MQITGARPITIKNFSEVQEKMAIDTTSNQQGSSLWKVEVPINNYFLSADSISASCMYKVEESSLSTKKIKHIDESVSDIAQTQVRMAYGSPSLSFSVTKEGIEHAPDKTAATKHSGSKKLIGKEIDSKEVVSLDVALSNGYSRLNELPINFIWIGSIIPTRYRDNILQWSEQFPERLHVLWGHGKSMSSEDMETMKKLMNKKNIRFLDIAESRFIQETPILCDSDLAKWLFVKREGKKKIYHYVAASDIYRIALMYFGSDIITEMLPEDDLYKKKLVNTGMIYFDTDILLESVKGISDCLFKGVLEFNEGNDIFAASEGKMAFFKELLDKVLEGVGHNMKQNSIDYFKGMEQVTECSFRLSKRMKCIYFNSSIHYVQFPFLNPVRCADGSWQDGGAINMERPVLAGLTHVLNDSHQYSQTKWCTIL